MELLDTCRRELESELARIIATPTVYIVFAAEADFQTYGNFWAITSPGLSACFRHALADRWCGHAPAMLVDADALLKYRAGHEADAADLLAAVAAHEAAHFVTRRQLFDPWADDNSTALAATVAEPSWQDRPSSHPTEQHGPQWLRALIHIVHRLRCQELYVPWMFSADWNEIAISGPWNYAGALGDELERMDPLAAVLKSPIPAEFTQLFENDRTYVGSAN